MKTSKRLLDEIERHKAAIAKHRDALREIHDDIEGVLQDAVDSLSELL